MDECTRPFGLHNIGNTCFMNAALQMLGASSSALPNFFRGLIAQLHAWRVIYRVHRVAIASSTTSRTIDNGVGRLLGALGRPPLSPRAVHFFLDLVRIIALTVIPHEARFVCAAPPELAEFEIFNASATSSADAEIGNRCGNVEKECETECSDSDEFVDFFLSRQDASLAAYLDAHSRHASAPGESIGVLPSSTDFLSYPFAAPRLSVSSKSVARHAASISALPTQPPLRMQLVRCVLTHAEQLADRLLALTGSNTASTQRRRACVESANEALLVAPSAPDEVSSSWWWWLRWRQRPANKSPSPAPAATDASDWEDSSDSDECGDAHSDLTHDFAAFDDDELEQSTDWSAPETSLQGSSSATSSSSRARFRALRQHVMRELECSDWLTHNADQAVDDDTNASLLNLQQQDSHEFLSRLLAWLSTLTQRTLACAHHLHHQFFNAPRVVVPRIDAASVADLADNNLDTDTVAPDVGSHLYRLLQNALCFLLNPFWLRFNAAPPFVGTQGSELKCVLQHAPLIRCSEFAMLSLAVDSECALSLPGLLHAYTRSQRLDEVVCPTCSASTYSQELGAELAASVGASDAPPRNSTSGQSRRMPRKTPRRSLDARSAATYAAIASEHEVAIRRGLSDAELPAVHWHWHQGSMYPSTVPLVSVPSTSSLASVQLVTIEAAVDHDTTNRAMVSSIVSPRPSLQLELVSPAAFAPACVYTRTRVAASKQVRLLHYPRVLVLHVARSGVDGTKSHAHVAFPLTWRTSDALELRATALSSTTLVKPQLESARSLVQAECVACAPPPPTEAAALAPRAALVSSSSSTSASHYSLCAIVEHLGGGSGGHYICYRRRADRWYRMDDRNAVQVDEARVRSAQAYLLCYERSG